jgi:hypothetical protein
VTTIMNNASITDSVLHGLESVVSGLPSGAFAVVMYLVNIPLAFLVPSSSGHATLAMPIMAPLGDFAGVSRAMVVTAYQSSSGWMNLFTPHLGDRDGRAGAVPGPLRPVPAISAGSTQARAHHGLAAACRAAGDPGQAGQRWRHALAIYSDLGVRQAASMHVRPDSGIRSTEDPAGAGGTGAGISG